uniref:Putative ribonuclease H-like domain-containing protein n=1 Tax=Tanacetum cinerariifolium TaxID=118510 RepID=A0A6L2NAA0_TANCI|nr:putative ribonuclease H-like domain-containing protein [Tanacetum cinerariifolium]
MIPEPCDPNREVPENETFHMQTDDKLTKKELKQIEPDDQLFTPFLSVFLKTSMQLLIVVKLLRKSGYNVGNLNGYNDVHNVRNQNLNGNDNLVAALTEGNATGHNGNQIRCYTYRGEEAGIQLQDEEFDLMAAATDLDEIEEVNANCILMANLQQVSTSSTQTDKAPVYDSDGSTKVHDYKNCFDDDILYMFTQEEQYTKLLKPIPESHQVPHNDNNVISEVTSMEQSKGTVEQHLANVEEARVLYDSLYHNLAIKVEKVNTVNFKLNETNAKLTTKRARFKNQEKSLEISQEKYDKLERCYQKSVYQQQCLSKKINALHLSFEFSDDTTRSVARKFLNEVKSTIVTLQRVVKHRMTIKTNNWSSSAHQEHHKILKDENFPIVNQVDARVQNFEIQFLKEASKFVGDFKSLAKEVDESLAKQKALELEIERLLREQFINGKRYVLVIVDDYSRYTWVHFLRSKDEAPEVIKTFLKRITILLQSPVIIIRTDNSTEFKNQVLKEYFDSVGISHQVSSVRTPQQNGVVERRNRTIVEAARTMLIFSRAPLFLWAEAIANACFTQTSSIIHRRFNKTPYELINGKKPDISFLHVFGALCYPKNDHEDIGKLGAKGLDLTYAPSTITTQQPTEGELDLLFEAMYDDYIGVQPSAALRTNSAAQVHQVRQTSTTSTSIVDTAPMPINSSSQATNFPISLQDVDEINSQQQHVQQQGNQASL